jgi:hypothetical protein
MSAQERAERFIRKRKIHFRTTVGAASVLAVLLVVLGFGAYGSVTPTSERLLPPPASSEISVPPSIQVGVPVDLADANLPVDVQAPTRLEIPAIGVDTTVSPLGRNPNGTAQVPSTANYAGWYDLGPRPGEIGPAVILGHVDSVSGPGVFFRLKSLLPGDIITVVSGKQTYRFEVSRLLTYPKSDFPTEAVFGTTPDSELRLITCTGAFDTATGHYVDNVVVFAIRVG